MALLTFLNVVKSVANSMFVVEVMIANHPKCEPCFKLMFSILGDVDRYLKTQYLFAAFLCCEPSTLKIKSKKSKSAEILRTTHRAP